MMLMHATGGHGELNLIPPWPVPSLIKMWGRKQLVLRPVLPLRNCRMARSLLLLWIYPALLPDIHRRRRLLPPRRRPSSASMESPRTPRPLKIKSASRHQPPSSDHNYSTSTTLLRDATTVRTIVDDASTVRQRPLRSTLHTAVVTIVNRDISCRCRSIFAWPCLTVLLRGDFNFAYQRPREMHDSLVEGDRPVGTDVDRAEDPSVYRIASDWP